MMVIAIGEVIVVVVLRPIRFLLGGQRTPLGRAVLRFENWILHHLHIMGAESRMRHELEMHGQASGFLAEGLSNQANVMQSLDDTVNRVRDETGASHQDSLDTARQQATRSLRRGQRQVESRGGQRSDDIHDAMLEAQRRQRREEERARRRQSSRS